MKIYFAIGYPPDKVKLCKSWKIIKSSKLIGPTRRQYQLFKALEENSIFWKEILTSRKNLGIPNQGWNWKVTRAFHFPREYSSTKLDKFFKSKNAHTLFESRRKEERRIKKVLAIHPYIESEIDDLIISNIVFPEPIEPIFLSADAYDEDDEIIEDLSTAKEIYLAQIVFTEQVSKRQLIEYIKNEWHTIDELNRKLQDTSSPFISKRDLLAVRLRDQGKLTFKQIVEEIEKKLNLDNLDGSINEDSVKTAYHRAKAKITSLAKKR